MSDILLSNRLEQAVLKVYQSINKRNNVNWMYYCEHSLWYELVACILGSKVPFEHAQTAASCLRDRGLLDVEDCFRNSLQFESRITEALMHQVSPPDAPERTWKYRYPRLRANHIRRTAESIYGECGSIKAILESSKDPGSVRIRIVEASVGIGPKQSSLFLRNIGYSDNIAILDTHVLRYMFLLGILQVRTQVVSTIAHYQDIEEHLRAYTNKLGANLAYLDTAIWITMRVFQRESMI